MVYEVRYFNSLIENQMPIGLFKYVAYMVYGSRMLPLSNENRVHMGAWVNAFINKTRLKLPL